MLFWETLQNWADWGRVFADWAAFAPLVREIFRRSGLPMGEVRALPPGTNAVFRVGDLVVKIYAPAETGVGQELGRESEVQAMRAAAAVGVHTAGVVAAGELADRYAFSYLVTRFVSGAALGDVVREGSAAERRAIGRELGEITRRLHGASPNACPACAVDLFARSQDNPRWDMVPPALARELLARAKTVWARRDRRVLVHADLTGENVLRLPSGEFAVLDFGDAVLAPACVELPSLVLGGGRRRRGGGVRRLGRRGRGGGAAGRPVAARLRGQPRPRFLRTARPFAGRDCGGRGGACPDASAGLVRVRIFCTACAVRCIRGGWFFSVRWVLGLAHASFPCGQKGV